MDISNFYELCIFASGIICAFLIKLLDYFGDFVFNLALYFVDKRKSLKQEKK